MLQPKLLNKISKMIDKLKLEENIFDDVDKKEVLNKIKKILNESSSNLDSFSDEELFKIVKRILAVETLSKLNNEIIS